MYNHVCSLLPFYGCEFNEGLHFHVWNERNCGSATFLSTKSSHSLSLSLSLALALGISIFNHNFCVHGIKILK